MGYTRIMTREISRYFSLSSLEADESSLSNRTAQTDTRTGKFRS